MKYRGNVNQGSTSRTENAQMCLPLIDYVVEYLILDRVLFGIGVSQRILVSESALIS